MSWPPLWVSQVAYRFPAESMPSEPSIHHSAESIDSLAGPSRFGLDHFRPSSVDAAK